MINALYRTVDQIFIGNSELGYLGNAATGVVFPITVIALAFAWGFGNGAAAFFSICQGKQDTKNSHKCIGTALVVTLVVSIILMAICFGFMEPILRSFGASDVTIDMAMDYLKILLYVFSLYMIANMLGSIIRADGSPRFSMVSVVTGGLLNIVLDPIFIFGLHLGIKGAVYATIIGQTVSFFICFIYLFRTKTFKLTSESFKPYFKVFSNAVKLDISTFITQMSIFIIALVSNATLAKYGALSKYGADIPISVMSIETKVLTIVVNIVVGLIIGAQSILGYNYGARNYKRVKEIFRVSFVTIIIIGLIATVIFEFFPT